ncbi:hypothetical protein RND71_023289 [Anisodus tanguticus]|uniref:Uncharacterized protein n=1 Tax=Anisodus tanguticus TaxID=243964 RepID=A0AAE1RUV8_9SOLA|nr:hypothetical protein RND71_023289 [Anisodus tanguticus]
MVPLLFLTFLETRLRLICSFKTKRYHPLINSANSPLNFYLANFFLRRRRQSRVIGDFTWRWRSTHNKEEVTGKVL